jgi:hypothetical protein
VTSVSGGNPTSATVHGDPMMTGFDGRPFEFVGEPDTFYNLISERHHQVGGPARNRSKSQDFCFFKEIEGMIKGMAGTAADTIHTCWSCDHSFSKSQG